MTNNDKDYFVHESSYVDDGAQVGKETKIWHFSHVREDASIGENCTLGQSVLVGTNVHIGDNVKVQNNVSVYEGVTLEDDVFCGPSMVFTNVDRPRSDYPTESDDYLETLVRKGATIGANATIVCGHTIGKYAFIGAGSVVTKEIPNYAIYYGNPAKHHGWICQCGKKLEFENSYAECDACKTEYVKEDDKVRCL